MDESTNKFDLTAEQQDTATLLDRLLGKAIADRYVDFCRLTAGAFGLNVSSPVAAHVLRELESMLRGLLEVPMEATRPQASADLELLDRARQQLRGLGYDFASVERAVRGLNHFSHKEQIQRIVGRLGLDTNGDIARKWMSLVDSFGKAHRRSFHHSLKVDKEFRIRYQQPFDSVIRAVAVALEGRYASLMHRVEEITAMSNRSEAVGAFAAEIPGALPLQWHFYQRLTTGDWLPHLAKKQLLGEPLFDPEANNSFRGGVWPAGDYLRRMAISSDLETRRRVVDALRAVGTSMNPDIRQSAMDALAALPANEAESLVELAISWLDREATFGVVNAAVQLVGNLAADSRPSATLMVATALLQVWDANGEVGNLFGRHMYEHHLPSIAQALTDACGEDALRFLTNLLAEVAQIAGHIEYGHFSDRAIADDEAAQYDIYSALLAATRRSAETIVGKDPARICNGYSTLGSHGQRLKYRRFFLRAMPISALLRGVVTSVTIEDR